MSNNSVFDAKIKQMSFNKLSDSEKRNHKAKTIEAIFEQLGNRENRYIFYCPDINMINNLVKLIYETAFEVQELGYKVMILHEINGFKCKWLFETYSHLRDLEVDYIIKKKSSKSKKTRSQYAFKPTDTLIVPDQFQEVLDNLADVRLMQKVLLASSHTGIGSLVPATDYSVIGVTKVLFVEDRLKEDYESLFKLDSHVISYPINTDLFNKDNVKPTEVFPVIAVSNIGNNDLTQAVINIFHAKYPNLRTFTFKVLPRDSFDNYIETLQQCALLLILDKNMGNNQMIFEALQMGVPVGTTIRRECAGELGEQVFMGTDAFEIADNLALFVEQWLNNSTTLFTTSITDIADSMNLSSYTYENFSEKLRVAFNDLQDERVKFFATIKQSIEKQEELAAAEVQNA
jgi:hypothetical protein